jgi:hypothetical protein
MIAATNARQGGEAMIGPSLTALSAALLSVALLVAPGRAADRPSETRIDLFDTKSNRTGYGIVDERSGRVDLYDTKSNRTGYGTIDKSGRLDSFDTKGNRTGSGQAAPDSSRPGGRR